MEILINRTCPACLASVSSMNKHSGNSLTGGCYMGSKDEDVVKYFGKNIVFTYAQIDLKLM